MATLASNSLNTLINMGPDAMSNMFRIKISNEAFKDIIIRTTKVTVPTKNRKTMDLPYHNTKATISTPFFKYERRVTFTLRIDAAYNAYNLFKKCIATNYLDEATGRSGANVGTITVEQINQSELTIYTWKFYNCEIVSVGDSTNLDYGSSNPVTANITFIFETMDDAPSIAANAYRYYSPASLQAERITQGVAGEEELEEYNDYWAAYGKHIQKHDEATYIREHTRTTGGGGVNTAPEGFVFVDGAYVPKASYEAQQARESYQERSTNYTAAEVNANIAHEKAEREAAEARADYQSRS